MSASSFVGQRPGHGAVADKRWTSAHLKNLMEQSSTVQPKKIALHEAARVADVAFRAIGWAVIGRRVSLSAPFSQTMAESDPLAAMLAAPAEDYEAFVRSFAGMATGSNELWAAAVRQRGVWAVVEVWCGARGCAS